MRRIRLIFQLAWLSVLLLPAVAAAAGLPPARATAHRTVAVASVPALRDAIENAQAGDDIVIAAGTYAITGNITASTPGSAAAPISVHAAAGAKVVIQFQNAPGAAEEGFRIEAPWWTFEGLEIEGACASDDDCEHAFHLLGGADHTVIRDNRVHDFNAQIKANGSDTGTPAAVFPDDVVIEDNAFYDTRPRNTANPVTKIDVVGGQRWIVRANAIHDFEKQGGNTISYAAFLKGNSSDGLFERNLVRCAWHFTGGTRLGLSLGGGGTGAAYCEGGSCATEHRNGTIRNNVIIGCSDVGIYLNKAQNSFIANNTLIDTSGIDVRYGTSSADVRNNVLSGRIRDRDGGTSTREGNLVQVSDAEIAAWFVDAASGDFRLLDGSAIVDQGAAAASVTDDFCATPRNDGAWDIGAFEYTPDAACLADVGGGTPFDLIFANGFDPAP